jgi:membrane dipeptidase
MIDDLRQEIAESEDKIYLARAARDLAPDVRRGRLAALLSLEGAEPLGTDLGILRLMYDLGLRALGLTWFRRTMLANGTGEEEAGGGLTRFGRAVVRECNRLSILVDVSHLSERGFWDPTAVTNADAAATAIAAGLLRPEDLEGPDPVSDEEYEVARQRGAGWK